MGANEVNQWMTEIKIIMTRIKTDVCITTATPTAYHKYFMLFQTVYIYACILMRRTENERVSMFVYVHERVYTCTCAHMYVCVHFIPVITDLFLATFAICCLAMIHPICCWHIICWGCISGWAYDYLSVPDTCMHEKWQQVIQVCLCYLCDVCWEPLTPSVYWLY